MEEITLRKFVRPQRLEYNSIVVNREDDERVVINYVVVEAIHVLLCVSRFVTAVKLLRETYGFTLYEGKQVVDMIAVKYPSRELD